jgi:hypothetical protein
MTDKKQYYLLDEIGFIGTQDGLSATRRKEIDRRIEQFLRAQRKLKKSKSKKAS